MTAQFQNVYMGPWIDWSRGKILGATLTLSQRNGAFLVAALAIFVTWTGGHLWGIIRFIAHSVQSTNTPQDGLYHQKQVVARNSETPGSSIWSLTQLMFGWTRGSRAERAICRVLPLLLVGITYLIALTAAGIFSSRVTETGGAVLLASTNCGFIDVTDVKEPVAPSVLGDALYVYKLSLARSSVSFARSCYAESDSDFSGGRGCAGFPRPSVGSHRVNTTAACPFDDSMCDAPGSLELDTGLISSADFGLNTEPSERVWFRKITSWSPINTANHTTVTEDKSLLAGMEPEDQTQLPGETFTFYWLGKINLIGREVNWTFSGSNYSSRFDSGYEIVPVSDFVGDPDFEWEPIPALARSNADVTLIRKANLVNYVTEIQDPWFRATVAYNDSRAFQATLYKSSDLYSVLGATEQYQFCTSETGDVCSPWTGHTFENYSTWTQFTEKQRDVVGILAEASYFSNMRALTYHLGREILLAHDYLLSLEVAVSVDLPENQWMIEAENMHNTSLAMMQHKLVELPSPRRVDILSAGSRYDTSQFISPLDRYANGSMQTATRLCGQMKVHSFEFASFNQLAIILIVSIGSIILLLNCFLVSAVNAVRKSLGFQGYKRLEWIETGTLHLQRATFEARNILPWARRFESVPVTEERGKRWVAVDTAERVSLGNASDEESESHI